MFNRYCVPCDRRTNDTVCACGRVTEIVVLDDEYTQDEMEADLENGHGETEGQKLSDPVCPRTRWAD